MIELQDVHKTYDTGTKALNGISMKIDDGEFVFLVGPSGSGKSTLLRSLNLLEVPTAGEIDFDGVDITKKKVKNEAGKWVKLDLDKHRQKMGMVFQHFNLFPHMTILDNMTLAPIHVKHMPKAEAEQKAHALLERVGLGDRAEAYPIQLSGGQKQRISIARVFLKDPGILILDEATSALDNQTEMEIQQELFELAKGRTCIIVAHRLSTIKSANEIVVLTPSGIAERGSHRELMALGGMYANLYNYQIIDL